MHIEQNVIPSVNVSEGDFQLKMEEKNAAEGHLRCDELLTIQSLLHIAHLIIIFCEEQVKRVKEQKIVLHFV